MLDEYIFGDVTRISPEAPIPVVKLHKRDYKLGGASNVANNIIGLGGGVYLCGVIGNDTNGQKLKIKLLQKGINIEGLVVDNSRPTITKTRVMAQHLHHPYQQFVRVDEEEESKISKDVEAQLIVNLERIVPKVDLIIISDYDKGILTENLIKKILSLSNIHKKLNLVNAKPNNAFLFKDFNYIMLNRSETERITKVSLKELDKESIEKAGQILLKELNVDGFLTTCDKHGVIVYDKEGYNHVPTKVKDVADVSGAGDTFITAFSLSLASGASLYDSVVIANHAAGIVVGKIGTSTVSLEELKSAIQDEFKN